MRRLPALSLALLAVAGSAVNAQQPATCETVTPLIEDLRNAAFLNRKACANDKDLDAIKEAIWRYRLTIGSPATGVLNDVERILLKDRKKRADIREPLKADLQDDEVKRQLISTGALDSDIEHATLHALREAVIRFRTATGSVSIGPLDATEKVQLQAARQTLAEFAGFAKLKYPDGETDIVVPVNLVGSKANGDTAWVDYTSAEMGVHYFYNKVRAHTSSSMATRLLEKRLGLYFEYLKLSGDHFVIEGSAWKRNSKDQALPERELLMATGREQNGRLLGVHVKTFLDPPISFQIPHLKISELPPDQLPSKSRLPDPETPQQLNWRLVVKSINNLLISDFYSANGRNGYSVGDCRGVQAEPALNRKVVNIVYATDRKFLGSLNGSPKNSLKNYYSGEQAAEMRVGCIRVYVPNPQKGEDVTEIDNPSEQKGAAKPAANVEAKPRQLEFGLPKVDPIKIDLTGRERFYFSASERTVISSYDRAMLFIHGYNNDFEEAIKRTAQIAADSDYSGYVYCFSWPSQGRFVRYATDMDNAEQAELHLVEFMRMILAAGVETRLDVVAHSMGAQMLLRTIDGLRPVFDYRAGMQESGKVSLGQIIFAAPDVAEPVFKQKIAQLRSFAERVTVYASANDGALDFSGWLRGVARAGSVGFGANARPIDVENVDMIDITQKLVPRYLVQRYYYSTHSAFAFDQLVREDITDILRQSARNEREARLPPNLRAARAGHPRKFLPGDCKDLKLGKIKWWKMQTADNAIPECPAEKTTPPPVAAN